MSRKKSIDEWALDYWLLQRYAKLCFRIYYGKITVINRQNIPHRQSVILAPNHQNALMDAMVLVCNMESQIVFLARADIFKGKFLIRILTFLNIMPVYRIRDGIENVKRNDEVFGKTVQVLRNKLNPLGLFPEGNHGDKRRLRNLVKGLFRIALMAQENAGEGPEIKIIPIGFDYGHYQHFRSSLFVNIGKPIEVSEYYGLYKENQAQAINLLKERYAGEVRKLMIDIHTEEYYATYMALRIIFNEEMRKWKDINDSSLNGRFQADKAMIEMLDQELATNPDTLSKLRQLVSGYEDGVKKAGLRDWVLHKERYSYGGLLIRALGMLILFPLFITGLISNYLPYWFVGSRIKGIKDPQFQSSFKYVIGMIAFPVWYLIIAGILCFVPVPLWIKLMYFLLLLPTGIFAFNYFIRLKKLRSQFSYTTGVDRKIPDILKIKHLRGEILDTMHDLVRRQTAVNVYSR